nr:hypothetical protein [uncultured Chryseobacterium sp.]
MKEKKLNKLVLNKKIISKLNQSAIAGGQLGIDNSLEPITDQVACPSGPTVTRNSCRCTDPSLPPTSGLDTTTDMLTRRGCA